MLEDLPEPEPVVFPSNTKLKTDFVLIEFNDDGSTAKVTFGQVKGYMDEKGVLRKDENTRHKTAVDGLLLTSKMGPKEILQAAKEEAVNRAETKRLEDVSTLERLTKGSVQNGN